MNLKTIIPVTLFLTSMMTACMPAIPPVPVNEPKKPKKHSPQLPKTDLDETLKVFKTGGQPGVISVSGVLVNQQDLVDSRIQISFSTGVSKDKKRPEVQPYSQPRLSKDFTNSNDLMGIENENTLLTVGCDWAQTEAYAKEKSLAIKPIPEVSAHNSLTLIAHTVVLCGNYENNHATVFSVRAHQLILENFNYKQRDIFLGGTLLMANHLFLKGANKIATNGIDGEVILSSAPTIEINISQSFEAEELSTLRLESHGASYVETKK